MCVSSNLSPRSISSLPASYLGLCLPTCCRCSPFANTYSVAPFVRVALGFGDSSGGIRFQFLIIYQCGVSCSTTSVSTTTYSSSSDRILKLHQMRWWGTVGQWSVSSRLTSRGEEQMSDIPTCPIFVIIIQLFLWVTLGYVTDSASGGAAAVSVLTVILWMMCGSWCFPSPRSSSVNNSTDLQFDGSIITEEKKNKRNKRSDSTTVLNYNAPTDWDGWTRCDEMRDRWWL